MGKGKTPEMDESQGLQCPGHSNWTICSLFSQFCSPNFPIFSPSFWEANSYYPRAIAQSEEGWKWEKGKHQKYMRVRVGSARGIQIGPFAAYQDNFVQQIFQLFYFHAERPILITPEWGRLKMGNVKSPEMDESQGLQCLGHSNRTICSLLSQFCTPNFPTFLLFFWEANSYYTRVRLVEGSSTQLQ